MSPTQLERPARPATATFAFWCIAAMFLVVMAGTTLPSPLFGLYEQRLHISSLSVTVIYGIYSVGVVVALVALARFGSRAGLRARLAAGLALSTLSAAIFLATTSLDLLIAARLCSGLAAGLASGTATSAMIELGGRSNRGRSAVIAVGFNFGGLAIGTAMAGVLSDLGSHELTLPFLVDLIAGLAVMPAVFAVPGGSPAALHQGGRAPFPRRLFIQATVSGGVGFAANGLVAALTAVFLSENLHRDSRVLAGGVLAILFLSTAAGQLIVRRTPPRLAPIVGSAGLIIGLALLATTLLAPSLPGLVVTAIAIGASAGICTGAGLVSLAIAVPEAQLERVAAAYYIVLYGSIAVPVIGDGLIARYAGLVSACLIVLAVLAVAVVAALVSVARDSTRRPA